MRPSREELAKALHDRFGYPGADDVEWEELDKEVRNDWLEDADALLNSDALKNARIGNAINQWENLDKRPEELAETIRKYAPQTYALIQHAALSEVADRWQWKAWADVLLPASVPPAIPSIDYANRITAWLREQAASLTKKDEQ